MRVGRVCVGRLRVGRLRVSRGRLFGCRPCCRLLAQRLRRLGFRARLLLRGLRLGLGSGFGLERRLGFADLRKPTVATRKLAGKLVAPTALAVFRVLVGIDLLGASQQLGNLLLESFFGLAHALVAHRLVLRGVRLELAAVDRDVPQLDQPCLLAKPQDLRKKVGKGRQVLLTKRRDAVVIRMLIASEHAKRDVFVGRSLDLPGGWPTHAVAVHEQRDHHRRVKAGSPSVILRLVHGVNRAQVQARNHVEHEQRQMPLRQPLTEVRRHQQPLVQRVG